MQRTGRAGVLITAPSDKRQGCGSVLGQVRVSSGSVLGQVRVGVLILLRIGIMQSRICPRSWFTPTAWWFGEEADPLLTVRRGARGTATRLHGDQPQTVQELHAAL